MGAVGFEVNFVHLHEQGFHLLHGQRGWATHDGVASEPRQDRFHGFFHAWGSAKLGEVVDGVSDHGFVPSFGEDGGDGLERKGVAAKRVDFETDLFKKLEVVGQSLGAQGVEFEALGKQQRLNFFVGRGEGFFEAFKTDAFVGGVLVDDDHARGVFADDVHAFELADDFEARKILAGLDVADFAERDARWFGERGCASGGKTLLEVFQAAWCLKKRGEDVAALGGFEGGLEFGEAVVSGVEGFKGGGVGAEVSTGGVGELDGGFEDVFFWGFFEPGGDRELVGDGVVDGAEDGVGVVKTDFGFGGVDVDVDE